MPGHRPLGLSPGPVYLDYNATTPVDPRVAAVVQRYLTRDFGNPSSSHAFGEVAHVALEVARSQVAALIGVGPAPDAGSAGVDLPGEVVFTGSGSEANLLALRGAVFASRPGARPKTHIVTQSTEHPAVLATCEALARHHGVRVTILEVGEDGLVDPTALEELLAGPTSSTTAGEATLVSVMIADNETGAIQPVRQLADVAHRYGAIMHSDAAQAAGKVRLDVEELGVDLLTIVGHKMYAPKGVAALYVGPRINLEPVVYGGGQEHGLRAGTENVALIAGFGEAARLAVHDLDHGSVDRLAGLRDRLHVGLRESLPGRVHLNGPSTPNGPRLPNTLNVSIDSILAHQVLENATGIAASTGSACHSGIHTPSPVLTAMGLPPERALGAIRLSLGRWTSVGEVDEAIQTLTIAVESHDSRASARESRSPASG